MARHQIVPERRTLHGHFSRDLPPILTIDPGDTVTFRLLDAGWGLEGQREDASLRQRFEPRDPELDRGHALCGPIAIRGAEPGLTLVIQIGALRTGAYGWTAGGGWDSPLNRRLGLVDVEEVVLRWELDPDNGTGIDQFGHRLTLSPFLGVIGMPPAEPGVWPTAPPRPTGGNLDCKELVPGSRLELPIAVPGGLVSVGDGHGRQGDGEVSGTAIECPMEIAELTFSLREDRPISAPRAETPAGWLTFGVHEDLDEAMAMAVAGMLDLIWERHAIPRAQAIALASMVVDLRITQVVNGVQGVHALLPHGALD